MEIYYSLYITLAILTVILCSYVIISYIRNKSYRVPPAGLMLSRTSSDLVFTLMFFLMLLTVDTTLDNEETPECKWYGPIFLLVFMTAQGYFTAMCWDLYRTLSNPFRRPNADKIKMHVIVWTFAGCMVGILAPFNIFRSRENYGICYTCDTGAKFNWYNLILVYFPLGFANLAGIVVTIYALKRLSNGLEKTFELRQLIIKKQLILVGCLLGLSIITVISWGIIIYAPSFGNGSDNIMCPKDKYTMCLKPSKVQSCQSNTEKNPKILLAILVLMNGGFDALAWFLLHKYTSDNDKDKIKKTIDINPTHHKTATLPMINDNETEQDHEELYKDGEAQEKKEQNVSNALRGEIIAYMTAGIERGIHNSSQETYERVYSYGDIHMDDMTLNPRHSVDIRNITQFDDDDDDDDYDDDDLNDDEKLNKHNQASQSRNREDMLACEEPEPQRAQYPMNIHQDPKTHKGVINEIYVQLQTQQLVSLGVQERISRLKSKVAVGTGISSSGRNSLDLVDDRSNRSNRTNRNKLKQHVQNGSSGHQSFNSSGNTTNKIVKVNKGYHKVTDLEDEDEDEDEDDNEVDRGTTHIYEDEDDDEEDLLSSLSVKKKHLERNGDGIDDDDDDDDELIHNADENRDDDEEEEIINIERDDEPTRTRTENVSIYESGRSDVEMQRTPSKKSKNGNVKLQELNDDIPFYRQGSTGSTGTGAGAVLSSITKTIFGSGADNNTGSGTTFGTTFPDPMFHTEEQYSFYDGDKSEEKKSDGIPFKDYAPHVFRYLRQRIYDITDEEYLQSVRPPDQEEQTKLVQEKFSEGRSGAFFFFTHDSKYIIKTVTKEEASLLLRILPDFVQHFTHNPKSLINRFFGLHSITMYNLNLYFVVLENVFVAGSKPHEIYDIKGSWIDRHTNHHVESGKLMKDQDLHKTLKLIPNIADEMYKQLKADSKFLASQNIMDYSVLLGIYYVGIDPSDVRNDRILQNHHDNAGGQSTDSYKPPPIDEEHDMNNEDTEEFKQHHTNLSITDVGGPNPLQLDQSLGAFPEDLKTIRNLKDDKHVRSSRPRAPSYGTGMRKFAQKEKAVTARVIEGPGIYYLGIIDVLQEWNTIKKLERMAKVYLRCKNKDGISCVEPNYYRKRFLRKMYRIGIRPLTRITGSVMNENSVNY